MKNRERTEVIDCSMFHLADFQTPFCRYYSTGKCSREDLTSCIEFVYKDLTENDNWNLPRELYESIHEKILIGVYVFYPLRVKFIKKVDLIDFLEKTLIEIPDILITNNKDSRILSIIFPNKVDVLVFMGLSLMLTNKVYVTLPKEKFNRLSSMEDSFYESLQKMRNVDTLYKFDLTESIRIIPKSVVLERVKEYVGDSFVLELVESFLNIHVIDDDGNDRSEFTSGIPLAGEITRILFNIVMIQIFDREFKLRFPGIEFVRFNDEVFVSTRLNDTVIFSERTGNEFLAERSLSGKILSIKPGDSPLSCNMRKRFVLLNNGGQVLVAKPEEYF